MSLITGSQVDTLQKSLNGAELTQSVTGAYQVQGVTAEPIVQERVIHRHVRIFFLPPMPRHFWATFS